MYVFVTDSEAQAPRLARIPHILATRSGSMATATLGKVEEFEGVREDWQQYIERLEYFFVANSITAADKKRAVFLSVIGSSTYKILRNLVAPDKPGDKEYGALVDVLSRHFKQKPSEIVERCNRTRKPGESVSTFVSELCSLCNFGDTLNVMIRDRLVCGTTTLCNDGCSRNPLAHSMERVAQNVKELKTKPEISNPALTYSSRSPHCFGSWGEQEDYTHLFPMWQARPHGSKLQSQQAGDMPQVWEARASQEGL